MRGRNIAIGVLAAAGFAAIVRLTGGSGGAPPPPAPPPPPAISDLPAGPEATPEPDEISVRSLLDEMVDLDRLARLPPASFTAGQAASTDRRSRRREDSDGWFANDDFVTDTLANLVRVETRPAGGKRYVLMDEQGPGAIVRIWTATTGGTLRINIDGDPTPVVEAPLAALLRGEVRPFVSPLAHVVARGHNLYFPFPYAKSCLVTVDDIVSPNPFTGQPMAKLYYQIGFRRYPPKYAGRVRPTSAAELARAEPTIARVARVLRDGPPPAGARPGAQTIAIPPTTVDREHRARALLVAPPGGGVVTELRITTSERSPEILRSTRLSIAFDDEGAVDTPLIDFFGTGPAWNTYTSLPMTVGDGVLVCRFRMPFAKRAAVAITRHGPGSIAVAGAVDIAAAPYGKDSLLFHAGSTGRQTVSTRPFVDWHVAGIEAHGHLVGTLLNVDNPPGTAWWGEGDEKITVDGETFPSLFGTGTEDYFGYAWSSTERFEHAYHAQTAAAGTGFGGLWSMNRFHILDPIPFARALRFDLEVWHWSETTLALDATVFWYARPGGRDDFHSPMGSLSRPAPRPAPRPLPR